jgi:hypothetical protein
MTSRAASAHHALRYCQGRAGASTTSTGISRFLYLVLTSRVGLRTLMKRLVLLTFAVGLLGCAGGAGPIDVFAGRWVGSVGGDTTTIVATQSGSTIRGTGTFVNIGVNVTMPFTGTSTPPDLSATFGGAVSPPSLPPHTSLPTASRELSSWGPFRRWLFPSRDSSAPRQGVR